MIDSFDEMLRYEEIILREMEIIKKQLRKSPKGKLRVSVNHGTSQYYNVGGDKEHIETYLSIRIRFCRASGRAFLIFRMKTEMK